jgi:hypothetical protein
MVTTVGARNAVAAVWDRSLNETTAGNPMSVGVRAVQAYRRSFNTQWTRVAADMRDATKPTSTYRDVVNFARSLTTAQSQLDNLARGFVPGTDFSPEMKDAFRAISGRMKGFIDRYQPEVDRLYGK